MTAQRTIIRSGTSIPNLVDDHYGTHGGKRAILIGKGPSLDSWIHERGCVEDDEIVYCLNETCLLFTEPEYVQIIDLTLLDVLGAEEWTVPRNTTIITRDIRDWRINGAGDDGILGFRYGNKPVPRRMASGGVALYILKNFGVRDVLMVGFDGYDDIADGTYANTVKSRTHSKEWSFRTRWRKANANIDRALKETGLAVEWWHRSNPTTR